MTRILENHMPKLMENIFDAKQYNILAIAIAIAAGKGFIDLIQEHIQKNISKAQFKIMLQSDNYLAYVKALEADEENIDNDILELMNALDARRLFQAEVGGRDSSDAHLERKNEFKF